MLLLKGTMFPQIGPSNGDKQTHNFSFGSLTSLTQEAPFRSMSKFSKWGYAFSTRAQVFQVRICQNLDCTFWEGWNRCPSLFSKYFLGRHGRRSLTGEAFGKFFLYISLECLVEKVTNMVSGGESSGEAVVPFGSLLPCWRLSTDWHWAGSASGPEVSLRPGCSSASNALNISPTFPFLIFPSHKLVFCWRLC